MTGSRAQFDDEAVRAASNGDSQQRSHVVTCLAEQVRTMVVIRLAPSPMRAQDVDDIVQESLAAISQALPAMREPSVGSLRALASTVVTRKVANYLADAKRRSNEQAISLNVPMGDGSTVGALRHLLSASGISPGSIAARRELIHNLLLSLAAMKDTHREVITMAIIDQLPITEVAERMNLTRAAASMLLFRAMKTLRRNITGSSRIGGSHEPAS
ncbi:MAG: sigma-70 family RNA polymerase sigma factor [Phycisphaerales bacterium]|nr:sigma-70 family RNA polymerase sigma factor [Phycisphaerales bacterium]MCB9862654.1 sigma-70 family RNA polymerase sigma factor [Phycisphaerales bacterium]